jgi:hypothetical protein
LRHHIPPRPAHGRRDELGADVAFAEAAFVDVDEINELRDQVHSGKAPPSVQPDTLAAIEQVREIGSIGAHMEADTNVIVDVDPEEAQILIDLAELLFEDWYIARNDRTKHLAKILSVAEQKKQKQEPAQKLDEEMPELSGPNVQVTRETKD